MDSPKIYFRTDGNLNLGLGHIIRCLALGQMLRQNFSITFFIKQPSSSVYEMVHREKFNIRSINDEEDFFNILIGDEIIVLDGYNFDTIYQRRIKGYGSFLVCIDDLHDKNFVADGIINAAPGVTKDQYKAETNTEYLLGPEYALLRPAFISEASKERILPDSDQIFINFGGSDVKNITLAVLQCVLRFSKIKKIVVITGSNYPHRSHLEGIIRENPLLIEHLHDLDEREMVKAILSSTLAIIPASGILFEVIACRTPCVSGYYVQNQYDIYSGFKSHGVFYDAHQFEEEKILSAINKAIESDPDEQIEKQKICIDGNSRFRLNRYFTSLKIK